jgi:uncharacterized protein (DUF983 family)
MTDTSQTGMQTPRTGYPEQRSGWVGWIFFAGVMLMLMGGFQIIQALVALFDDGFYLVGPSGLVVDVDYNTWGWVHLVLGIVAVLSGIGLLAGNLAARIVGVGVAFLSALVNLAFISAYPVWSSIIIVIDVIVIFAIIVHGSELKDDYR